MKREIRGLIKTVNNVHIVMDMGIALGIMSIQSELLCKIEIKL